MIETLTPSVAPMTPAVLSSGQFQTQFAQSWGETTTHSLVLAQQFDQDILGDLNDAFGNFVDSGQVWAMLIGFVIGYVFKSLTSYG